MSIAEELDLSLEEVVFMVAEDLDDGPASDGAPAPTSIEDVNRRLRLSAREKIEDARDDIRTKAAR
jgi:hypothetical protein